MAEITYTDDNVQVLTVVGEVSLRGVVWVRHHVVGIGIPPVVKKLTGDHISHVSRSSGLHIPCLRRKGRNPPPPALSGPFALPSLSFGVRQEE